MIKSVVITGSTHGIGYHMAAAFLEQGCQVTISGRTRLAVDDSIARLGVKYSPESILGVACDVTDFIQVQHLWGEAVHQFGRIEIWINNAGTASPRMDIWDVPAELYDEVVRANLIGTMFGVKVAMIGMLAQGYGALYNMEGFGARGGGMVGMTLYGSTKAAVHFINKSLAKEAKATPVITGAIAPGMMITDMITRQYVGREAELEQAKPILNIIAERPESVAPVLVKKILKNQKNGVTISYSSPVRIMLKFLAAPFNKRDLFTSQ